MPSPWKTNRSSGSPSSSEAPVPELPDQCQKSWRRGARPAPVDGVWPTWSFTATMVPPIGAVSVVSSTAFWSWVTVSLSWRTWLSSWRIVEETGASEASVPAMLCSCARYLALVVLHGLGVGRDHLLFGDT